MADIVYDKQDIFIFLAKTEVTKRHDTSKSQTKPIFIIPINYNPEIGMAPQKVYMH